MAVWLPATMHCNLELAGWMGSDHCASSCCHDHVESAPVDGDSQPHPDPGSCEVCSTVESGGYHRVPPVLLAKPELLLLWVAWFETQMTVPPEGLVRVWLLGESDPPDPGWRRRERVALPPRAPSAPDITQA